MKLEEIVILESKKEGKTGTFVGVRFSKKSENDIMKFIKDNDIPNADTIKNNGGLHSTLIYSRKVLDNFTPDENIKISAKVKGFKKLGDNAQCLVMELTAPKLVKRHKQIRKEHGATHDWGEYIPHITLSTDAGDFDIKKLSKFKKIIEIVEEYVMDLR